MPVKWTRPKKATKAPKADKPKDEAPNGDKTNGGKPKGKKEAK